MSEDPSVLLLGSPGPSEQLKALLEKQGIVGERIAETDLETRLRRTDPSLILHFGAAGTLEVVQIVKNARPHSAVRVVVIAERADMNDLRKLDRGLVASLLATDMPDSVLAARIAMLIRKKAQDAQAPTPQAAGVRAPAPEAPSLQAPPPQLTGTTPASREIEQAAKQAAAPPVKPASTAQSPGQSLLAMEDFDDEPTSLTDTTVELSIAEAMALRARPSSQAPPTTHSRLAPAPPPAEDERDPTTRSVTRPMSPPQNVHVLVADSDTMRGDAIVRNLRRNGINTLLVPLDPARTRWPLVRQFAPQLLLVDAVDLKTQGQVWYQLLLADQELGKTRLVATAFDRLFDETTGMVYFNALTPFLPELSGSEPHQMLTTLGGPLAGRSHELTDLDPTGIEEVPASDRPTFLGHKAEQATQEPSAPAPESEAAEPTLAPTPTQPEPPGVLEVVSHQPSFKPESAGKAFAFADPSLEDGIQAESQRSRLTRKVLFAALLLVALAGGATYAVRTWVSKTKAAAAAATAARTAAQAAQAHSAAIKPKAPVQEQAPPSPWIATPSENVRSCEELVPNLDELKKLGLEQANVSWDKARQALMLGNMDEAYQFLCEASLIHSESLAVEGLVELLLTKHLPERAEEWVEIAIKAHPERRKTLELKGDVLSQLGKVDEARATWLTALKLSPTEAHAQQEFSLHYEREGLAFLKDKNYGEAELWLRRAAILNPKSPGAAAGLGQSFVRQGLAELAQLWANKALELKPDFGPALVVLADLAFDRGKTDEAITLYKQALKSDPINIRAHQQVHLLTEKR